MSSILKVNVSFIQNYSFFEFQKLKWENLFYQNQKFKLRIKSRREKMYQLWTVDLQRNWTALIPSLVNARPNSNLKSGHSWQETRSKLASSKSTEEPVTTITAEDSYVNVLRHASKYLICWLWGSRIFSIQRPYDQVQILIFCFVIFLFLTHLVITIWPLWALQNKVTSSPGLFSKSAGESDSSIFTGNWLKTYQSFWWRLYVQRDFCSEAYFKKLKSLVMKLIFMKYGKVCRSDPRLFSMR